MPQPRYLQLYAPYEYLLSLNPDTYVEQLAEKGSDLTLAQVKQEVFKHERELELMEQQLPAAVCLGLVQVNCNKVRPISRHYPDLGLHRNTSCAP
jgi:hypothetical protein